MDAEERLRNKLLYKTELGLLKVIPMVIAFGYLLNTFLSFFEIETDLLSHMVGLSFLPLLFLYISSYAFRFCEYHRMFLHYVVANNLITFIDYYIGIPVSDLQLLMIHVIIAGVCLFLVLWLKRNCGKKR